MKCKILFLLAFLSSIVDAQEQTAILQQSDAFNVFYGTDAFKNAYDAAGSGAIIMLSTGTFDSVSSISKSIKIIGCNSLDESYPKTVINTMSINADNVEIEGVYFNSDVSLGNISNCHIKRCYFNTQLKSADSHTDTHVEQSVVKQDYAIGNGINYCINNSTVGGFYSAGEERAQITNCVVWNWLVQNNTTYMEPYAVYKNNILGVHSNNSNYQYGLFGSDFYYNLFVSNKNSEPYYYDGVQEGNSTDSYSDYLKTNKDNYPAPSLSTTFLGMDNTPVGIYGGSGFTMLPDIPKVVSSVIDPCTDSQGNFNVRITASTGGDKSDTDSSIRTIAWLRYWWNDRTDNSVKESAINESSTFTFSKSINVPEYAKTNAVGNTARFYFVVGDNEGYVSLIGYSDVEYPDNEAPVSVIQADKELVSGGVELKWYTVSDVAHDYNVYYSEDGGPFVLWLPNTTLERATFKGLPRHSYRFTVTARDKYYNCESIDENKIISIRFK